MALESNNPDNKKVEQFDSSTSDSPDHVETTKFKKTLETLISETPPHSTGSGWDKMEDVGKEKI
ncbi:hypothetical protein [Pseudomonas viridiflava]|uniref:hypothetical protein n=1 Tax=Pseudomonas viridiflava TaxID=33069 RepID=UPI0013CF092B|nr:hypothetical protein [Pseudomonas viridiflava]